MSHFSRRFVLPIALFAGVLAARPLFAQSKDAVLENAEGTLTLALTETADTAISRARNGAQVFSALRMSRDPSILPLFDRLRLSKIPENQAYGMVSYALIPRDPSKLDMKALIDIGDPSLIGSALAALIDADVISNDQLQKIVNDAPEAIHRAMAAGELNRRKALKDRAPLKSLLSNSKEIVRHYAAITLLQQKDEAENTAALAALNEMAAGHDLRIAPIQGILLLKVEKDEIPLAAPWVTLLAADEKNDEGLRQTAISTLLAIKGADAPRIFSELVAQQKDSVQQIKLGLIALEHADRLKPDQIAPLAKSKSPLARTIAGIALRAAEGNDITCDLIKLIKEGQPLVMNWSLAYSDHSDPERRLAIRTTLISMAAIIDDIRGPDFDRAALAAEKILDDKSPAARPALATLLKSNNPAAVEAVLAGMIRSNSDQSSELILPIWDSVSKSIATETSANYAAIILAREGRKEPIAWLSGMVQGGKVQNVGFRALAGWQYAKLTGQSDALLKRVLEKK